MRRETWYRAGAAAAVAALLLWYSQTRAFAWDEGYHLLAAQLVSKGKRLYLDFCFPQPPLNTYWNAAWMWLFGAGWRLVHAVSAVLCLAAAWIVSCWARSRFPDPAWRQAAALAVLLAVGLNVLIVQYGPIGQAYALTLVLIVTAFRLTVKAVETRGSVLSGLAGLAAGGGAAATLLSAPVGVVLLVWLVLCNQSGDRRRKAAALIAGEIAAFLPMWWLFVQDPRRVFFNVVEYELRYRQVEWEGAYAHDVKVWISWLDSSHGVVLALLAAGGLAFVRFRCYWTRQQRAEFYLCGWLSAALIVHISQAHPTFERYYMLAVPFLAVLAAAALYSLGSRWTVAVLGIVLAAGLAKTISEENAYTWPYLEPLARKVDQVTPAAAPVLADEHIYFLTRRTPPSGMELMDSHKLDFPKPKSVWLHLVSEAEVERRISAGEFATVESCGEYEQFDTAAALIYKQQAKAADCTVYWERK
ncbi:MAG TPA: hypothetical protein VMH28_16535 [Candidatus Acidoferrales bacterium]|nr:hypothetical protein [Candidatus Acidoferrales bacterium]